MRILSARIFSIFLAGKINFWKQELLTAALEFFKKRRMRILAPVFFLSLLARKLNKVKPMLTRKQLLRQKA